MNMLNLKRALASAIITGITATSALAADITMNVGFWCPRGITLRPVCAKFLKKKPKITPTERLM